MDPLKINSKNREFMEVLQTMDKGVHFGSLDLIDK